MDQPEGSQLEKCEEKKGETPRLKTTSQTQSRSCVDSKDHSDTKVVHHSKSKEDDDQVFEIGKLHIVSHEQTQNLTKILHEASQSGASDEGNSFLQNLPSNINHSLDNQFSKDPPPNQTEGFAEKKHSNAQEARKELEPMIMFQNSSSNKPPAYAQEPGRATQRPALSRGRTIEES